MYALLDIEVNESPQVPGFWGLEAHCFVAMYRIFVREYGDTDGSRDLGDRLVMQHVHERKYKNRRSLTTENDFSMGDCCFLGFGFIGIEPYFQRRILSNYV